ncbi:MAG: 4Fe-4S dicluster domain-containing protein [Anaerolineales bacterium]|nr:4Fe-4S dicluster domain-containing protein [Anaerolineales bacterium]
MSEIPVKTMSLDARLGLDKYEIDEQQSHIQVDQSLCQQCSLRPCLTVGPADVYKWVNEEVKVSYENCLECGTCQIACDYGGEGGITWLNPSGGYGILFRYG